MEWFNAMNAAIEYVEEHITDKLDIDKVAQIAFSSTYHFQRMYHMITGITIAEYVRRRRLTLAVQDIISGEKIVNIAYKYRYETPEAFSKAFARMYGVSPSNARKQGTKLKAYPKLSFHISIKGDKDMNYKIVEKESFMVLGRQKKISLVGGQNFKKVPEFWQECMENGSYEWMCSNVGNSGILCVSKDFDKLNEEFNYLIGVQKNKQTLPSGYISINIPAMTWAIFESVGAMPKAPQDLLHRIFAEWMPATGYQHACAPEIEVYPCKDMYSMDYKCEIWIPIEK